MPKFSVRESFIALISGTEEVWRRGGGEYQYFPSKIFCLTVRKLSVGEYLDVALISGSEKVYGQKRRGEYPEIPSKIFCLTVLNISVGESFTVALLSVTEKVRIRGRGKSRYSVENFLSHSAGKFS